MSKVNKELLDELFNIPRDGSNIDDSESDDSFAIRADSSGTFAEKAKEVNLEVEKTSEPNKQITLDSALPKPKEKEEVLLKPETKKVELPESRLEAKSEVKSVTLPTTLEVEPAPVIKKEESLSSEEDESEEEDEKQESKKSFETLISSNKSFYKFPNGNHIWKFNCPSDKYKYFYEEKKDVVFSLLKNDEIPFSKYYEELSKVSVDINVDAYDSDGILQRITEAMKWRDRVKYIQLHVNSQYFGFKNFEELLKGVLARIEYIRGKQEGLVYEHLSDFVGYLSELEGLLKNAEIVSKHLDAAYASLSRQISIAQPYNEIERQPFNQTKPLTKEMSRFDGLKTHANVSSNVVTNTVKEVAKATEPNPVRKGWDK